MKDVNKDNYVLDWREVPDAILCICCPSGLSALRKKYTSIPLLEISKLRGTLSYVYEDMEGMRRIVEDKSKAIVFGE
jgi:hypothetical protein